MRAALLALALGLAAAPAAGEMYRCTVDGRVLYTSDPSQCPGAAPHRPSGSLQVHESPPSEPAPGAAGRGDAGPGAGPARFDRDAARAAAWRQKKERARAELAEVERRLPELERAVGWCNRGDSIYVTDDLGIRRDVSCDALRREAEVAREARARLRAYLEEGGLAEECRRAGCLPGWIRD